MFLEHLANGYRACGVAGGRLLLAVSGGADSVALLCGTTALADRWNAELIVAHFDHGLRGADSAADAVWVRALGESLGWPVVIGSAQLASAPTGQVSEAELRSQRYRFLTQTAEEVQAATITTAHTQNDQAETVLHHLFRGSGLRGLAGIPRRRSLSQNVSLVRPMLGISRAMVEQFLHERGQEYRDDATNAERRWTRNRIRHDLLPELERQFSPGVALRLNALAEQAEEASDYIADVAEGAMRAAVVERDSHRCRLRRGVLMPHPDVVLREAYVQLWRMQGWSRREMTFAHWKRLCELTRFGGQSDLPGAVRVSYADGEIRLDRKG